MQLECGHVFHANCVLKLLKNKWNTLKISFAFMHCPSCKAEIKETRCKPINDELQKLNYLKKQVEQKAIEVAENEGLPNAERLTTPGDPYEGKLLDLALHSCTFFECNDCKRPYFGGLADCQ